VWYSVRYSADWTNVRVQRRPSDCDFLRSPLGGKKCSFSKKTYIFSDEERKAAIAVATTPEDKRDASQRPNLVVVYWEAKDEP